MWTGMNLCTAILPQFNLDEVLEIATTSGFKGIELRVNHDHHITLGDLLTSGQFLRRRIQHIGLDVPILTSYLPMEDDESVDRLIRAAQIMEVPKARVVLPRGCHAAVVKRAHINEIIPSYEASQDPQPLMGALRRQLRVLERKAFRAGVQLLLELHWGTVMSSFSSAYALIQDVDPESIGITFDPANMMVEGKEDWEFGINLIRPYLANVHVKNMRWKQTKEDWAWEWTGLTQGMVDWWELVSLLQGIGYGGDYAMEDFLTPRTDKEAAIHHLTEARQEFGAICIDCGDHDHRIDN